MTVLPTVGRPPFAVWAPRAETVTLVVGPTPDRAAEVPLTRQPDGWWQPAAPLAERPGEVAYGYRLDGEDTVLPDPRSRRQPDGVHGWSRTYDPATFGWSDHGWTGRPLPGSIVYELHVGTFTPAGTFEAAVERLDHLVELGVDVVELMPVNAYNGPHGWGYDGVLWFAVHEPYGGPEGYCRFVDACHARGLAVWQDVVYNHLGPSGNYLPRFGPYLNEGAANTWGRSPNLDGPESDEVRGYLLDNLRMWLVDYHVDGFRLDAVHALHDTRAVHILEEFATEVAALEPHLRRPLTLVAESDLNDPRLITSREGGGYGLTGQWSDDFHHALYGALTGDTSGYYVDFGSLTALAKVWERGFFHDGTRSTFRGRRHGRPLDPARTPAWRLVVCSDNHDQIGNRAAGQRLAELVGPPRQALAALVTLLSPFTPMIFMGEEWGAATRWPFFSSHPESELAEAVREGRVAEFAAMDWDVAAVPDPQDDQTFRDATLDWSELDQPRHADLLRVTREVVALRRAYPELTDPRLDTGSAVADDAGRWLRVRRGGLTLAVNFGDSPADVPLERPGDPVYLLGEVRLDGDVARLGPYSALLAR